jgi:hypothetical protein
VLALARRHRGLSRRHGAAVITGYAGFTVSVIISGYSATGGNALIIGLSVLSARPLAVAMAQGARLGHPEVRGLVNPSAKGEKPRGSAPAGRASRRPSLLPGWTAWRLWAVGMIATPAVAAVDAATGPRVVLIGLLIVGPCIALLTGWWLPTTMTGAWACGLAVLLGLPDGIWATGTHLAFVSAAAIVAAAAAAGAVLIRRPDLR